FRSRDRECVRRTEEQAIPISCRRIARRTRGGPHTALRSSPSSFLAARFLLRLCGRLGFGFRLRLRHGARNSGGENLVKKLLLFEILLGRRRLLMPVIVIVITSAAADLGRECGHYRNDGMVRNPAALDAMVVDYIP